jgi:hypothetical protein
MLPAHKEYLEAYLQLAQATSETCGSSKKCGSNADGDFENYVQAKQAAYDQYSAERDLGRVALQVRLIFLNA